MVVHAVDEQIKLSLRTLMSCHGLPKCGVRYARHPKQRQTKYLSFNIIIMGSTEQDDVNSGLEI
jgi:hypothetical protein